MVTLVVTGTAEIEGRGHTESHHLALHAAAYGGGQAAARHLANANILLCGIGLPLAPVEGDLNGIRLGSQELTRWGLKEPDMEKVARFIARVLVRGEEPQAIKPEVVAFREDFQRLKFVR